MIYTLKNNEITAEISSVGAEIMSVKKGGCEYIWQGDPEFWSRRTPIMFPICGRLFGSKYTFDGKEYDKMGIHGFVRDAEFQVIAATDTYLELLYSANEETRAQYPFEFELTVRYTLDGSGIRSDITIKNTDNKILPATFGAHPAFNVPLDKGAFDDWYVEFGEDCTPNELIQTSAGFNTGKKRALSLKNSRIIPLRHSLFDIDSIFMDKVAHTATLKSECSDRTVTLKYDDMSYLGLWHKPASEAPYVCIEPWCGLPSFDGQVDDFATKSDMFHILPGASKDVSYEIIFG